MKLEEGDVVLCTVIRIERTTVFVKIENGERGAEGTIITSEIAPGRIRNLRDHVVPGKKIVCKILSANHDNFHLSLRRVTLKEKKEVLDKYEKEKSSLSILKSVLKEKADIIAEKIKENGSIYDFLQLCKESPSKLEKYIPKEDATRICKILNERKEKEKQVKKEFSLTSNEKNGLEIIKKILLPYKSQVTYLSAGKYIIKVKAENYKKAEQEADKILEQVEEKAEKEKADFKAKEK